MKYTKDELDFVEQHCQMLRSDMHAEFVKRFGRCDISIRNLDELRKRNRWLTGRTGPPPGWKPRYKFPVGHRPANAFKVGNIPKHKFKRIREIGFEFLTKDGYTAIYIAPKHFVPKHRYLWEQKYGAIPAGYFLKCKGDRADSDPSNWELIPRGLISMLDGPQGRGYSRAPAELKPIIMAVTRLEHTLKERKRR
ncbi:HNH endonuclease [Nitrobacter sp. Nb-311A]|uniref:HNH endonuclease n=1 Tax=Nitrobacter sp. Nb-311A TaxID=314253 RepID=UPI001039B877|nr:HNH endonuclease [Nitrobacter sp. Nb-311A]